MKDFHIKLSEKLYQKLKKESQILGLSMSELIRKKIESFDEKRAENLKTFEVKINQILNNFFKNFESKIINNINNIIVNISKKNEKDFHKIKSLSKLIAYYTIYNNFYSSLVINLKAALRDEDITKLKNAKENIERQTQEILKKFKEEI